MDKINNLPDIRIDESELNEEQETFFFVLNGFEADKKNMDVAYWGFACWLVAVGLSLWASAAWDLGAWAYIHALTLVIVPLGLSLGANDQPRRVTVSDFIRFSYHKIPVQETKEVIFHYDKLEEGQPIHRIVFKFGKNSPLNFYMFAQTENETHTRELLRGIRSFLARKSIPVNFFNYNRFFDPIELLPDTELSTVNGKAKANKAKPH